MPCCHWNYPSTRPVSGRANLRDFQWLARPAPLESFPATPFMRGVIGAQVKWRCGSYYEVTNAAPIGELSRRALHWQWCFHPEKRLRC